MATGNGTSEENFTRAVPVSDAGPDDLAGGIADMIDDRVAGMWARLATVTKVNTGDARLAIQFWDDDGVGQELKARAAGTAYDVGNTVVCVPLGPTEWVVIAKTISSGADRATISQAELRDGSVRSQHIGGNQVTPAHLDRAYTTPAQLDAQIGTRVPVAPANDPVIRNNHLESRLVHKANTGHPHNADQVRLVTGADLQHVLRGVHQGLICLNKNYTNTQKNLCGTTIGPIEIG